MNPDTLDIKPTVQKIERDINDRPANRLIIAGIALMAFGAVAALVLVSYAAGDPRWIPPRESLNPLFCGIAIIGAVLLGNGIQIRVSNHRHEQIRSENREKLRKDLVEFILTIKKHLVDLFTSSETERRRREQGNKELLEDVRDSQRHLEARLPSVEEHVESRIEELDRKVDCHLTRLGSAVVNLGEQVGRIERRSADFVKQVTALTSELPQAMQAAAWAAAAEPVLEQLALMDARHKADLSETKAHIDKRFEDSQNQVNDIEKQREADLLQAREGVRKRFEDVHEQLDRMQAQMESAAAVAKSQHDAIAAAMRAMREEFLTAASEGDSGVVDIETARMFKRVDERLKGARPPDEN